MVFFLIVPPFILLQLNREVCVFQFVPLIEDNFGWNVKLEAMWV